MPFGSFEVKVKLKKPAAVKPPKVEKTMPVVPPEPKKEEQPVIVPMNEPVKPRMESGTVINSVTLHIAMFGRNLALIQEYLCAMNQNMSEAMHAEGMTFYTREMDTISDMTRIKKKLEQYFWQVSDQPWKYSVDEAESKEYVFSISPAGDQKRSLDLVMHCITPKTENMPNIETMDAVWVLTDGLQLDQNAATDSYTEFVKEKIRQTKGRADGTKQPACLIRGQIEKIGHFDTIDGQTKLPARAQKSLMEIGKKQFESVVGAGTEVAMIPVQIYGGLECVGKDEKGNPVLQLGESGYYQSLIQENNQMPVMYTILKICESRAIDYFDDMAAYGMKQVVQRHFAKKTGNAGWRPETLGGKKVE